MSWDCFLGTLKMLGEVMDFYILHNCNTLDTAFEY